MRTCLVLLAVLSACKWTEFDDLANTTWAHSDQRPDQVGSTDYAVAIADLGASSGGQLAVVSNDPPNFSTLQYDVHGGSKVGVSELLTQHTIASLGEQPIIVDDGAGNFAVVAVSTDMTQGMPIDTAFIGPPDSPTDVSIGVTQPPDAATWVPGGAELIVAAGSNLVLIDATNTAKICNPLDDQNMPLATAALAADDANVFVWTKGGAFFAYDRMDLEQNCTNAPTPATPATAMPAAFSPGTGARIHIVADSTASTEYAILAAHADKSTMGQVFVVNVQSLAMTLVGSMSADGIRSSAVGSYGPGVAPMFVALGFPERTVGGVATGQVELHAFDPGSGSLTDTAAEVLNDSQPDRNEVFGRDVATMKFDGSYILVVAASSEVFAYYRTSLYGDTRH